MRNYIKWGSTIIHDHFSPLKKFIRNVEFPICLHCVNFIEHVNNYPYDEMPNDGIYGRCKKFGEVNLVTGSIDYDFATRCRADSTKCGSIGKEYTYKLPTDCHINIKNEINK